MPDGGAPSPAISRSSARKDSPLLPRSSSDSSSSASSDMSQDRPANLKKDLGKFILLVLLYTLQGVPLGLVFGSIPFLLKSKLSFSEIAIFSLSSYPYSLKLLWSPIVDSIYFKSIGRRKSWIIPIQAITGIWLFSLGGTVDKILTLDELPVWSLALTFTTIVFLCATQDIAVDGWALTLLSRENKIYASTAQTIGLNSGYFLSFTVFLAFNSHEFCNKFIRSVPMDTGLLQLGPYLQFWGVMFLLCDLWLIFVQREETDSESTDDILTVYKTIMRVCLMPHMRQFIVLLMIAKIGFIANEAVTGLKLLEKGFHKEDLGMAVLIDFPFQLLFGYYAAKWSNGPKPLSPWLKAYYGRLLFAVIGMLVVAMFPTGGVTTTYLIIVITSTVLSSFMSTVQFVGMGSFFSKISDPSIGGTYMTLLNTLSNLGGTWPRYFVLKAVDLFTDSTCSLNDPVTNEAIQCLDDHTRHLCKNIGGVCNTARDGYYYVGTACVVFGLAALVFWINPVIQHLDRLSDHSWKLKKQEDKDAKPRLKKQAGKDSARSGKARNQD
ncbi:acetyl-coenzyme A transporter 1-domain-containing protein [Polychytrium aggregatum]|uniref:acetyl-coenzyme A transporter 1-domain-containing protein n=1 Tax=Polychytrium aggregatum TaxID=110093 RepID=UPI0022FF1999|nr:acetyl-coenzyme A transporter 1-domain-containing protein [Polychytrium aggregatum]KAI9206634.1 acetyl-coenzyme A transporter 1-domain-containing protein [Polychytrium aggregatum]